MLCDDNMYIRKTDNESGCFGTETNPYLAPEVNGKYKSAEKYVFTPAADCWAIGVTFYEVLKDKLPFNLNDNK